MTLSLDQKCFFPLPGHTWTGSFPVSVLVVASGEEGGWWGGRICPASASSRSLSGGGGESETRFYASIPPPFPFPSFRSFRFGKKRRREGLFRFRRPRRRRQGENEDGASHKTDGRKCQKEWDLCTTNSHRVNVARQGDKCGFGGSIPSSRLGGTEPEGGGGVCSPV